MTASPFIESEHCPCCGMTVTRGEPFVVTQRDEVWHRVCYIEGNIVEFPVAPHRLASLIIAWMVIPDGNISADLAKNRRNVPEREQ